MDAPVTPGSGPQNNAPAGRTLDSWKEIADFLGVSVRTAHRWEETARMPVRRTPAGHVWAVAEDLERWRRPRADTRQGWRKRVLAVAGAVAAVTAVAWAALWIANRPGEPVVVRIDEPQVTAFDEAGRPVWTAALPQRLGFTPEWGWKVSTPDHYVIADIDDDGRVEVVLNLLPEDPAKGPARLICFDDRGRVRWEFVLGRAFADQYGSYTLDYLGHIVRVVRIDGKPFVMSVATHRRWPPAQVALLDPSWGRVVEEFWHPGALTHAIVADLGLDGSPDLVLAGLNNPANGPGIPVLMTLRLPFSRQTAAPESLLAAMSSGGPSNYLAFPRPDVLEAQGGVAAVSHLAFEPPDSILARVRVTADSSTNLTFRLGADLHVRDVWPTIDLASVHDALWKAGQLDHPFSSDERAWLESPRRFPTIPDGSAVQPPPFSPVR
jgi:hypothetical protein